MAREVIPGPIVLFGSGEILPPSGKAHEFVAKKVGDPAKIAILETPAGFEPNSPHVAGNVGEFLLRRLQNYHPEIHIIPARKKGTDFSPDNQAILEPMLTAGWVFMGPGSPTYAVKELRDSLALEYLVGLHRLGTPISLASAAILAMSAQTLPVYEIYKVGEDLHWKTGLNFFEPYGLDLIFVPHWNNTDGGDDLDTSHCYMGKFRFEQLLNLLPGSYQIVGIDEHTSLVLDFKDACARVMGNGKVTIINGTEEKAYATGENFSLEVLGEFRLPPVNDLIRPDVLQQLLAARIRKVEPDNGIPADIQALVKQRETARQTKDWTKADQLRLEILESGWAVQDTPGGPVVVRNTSD